MTKKNRLGNKFKRLIYWSSSTHQIMMMIKKGIHLVAHRVCPQCASIDTWNVSPKKVKWLPLSKIIRDLLLLSKKKKKCMRLYYFMMQPLLGVIECHRFPTHRHSRFRFLFQSHEWKTHNELFTFTTFTNIQKNRLMIYGVWYNVFLPFSFYLFFRGRGLWGERWLKFSCICNSDAHILLSALDSLRKQDICVSKALLYFLLAYSIFRLLRTTACQ
jgi:hypothetical protein